MTDERMADALWGALDRLPRGSGVVFRHYGLPLAERRALFAKVRKVARRRGLVLVRAGSEPMRGESGVHGGRGRGIRTAPAHGRREAVAALRAGAHMLFVSPVFPTRSHPGAPALGRARFGLLIRGLDVPVIALGGMDARRARTLRPFGIHGWAAIDAWTGPKP
jgi:thiamine-phosphate pyrophosphorylase